MKASRFAVSNRLFSGERVHKTAVIRFKEKPVRHTADLTLKENLFDYFDFISTHKAIKAIIVFGPRLKMQKGEYARFYNKLSRLRLPRLGGDVALVERFYNAINQFVLKLAACDKIVISADCGPSPLLYLGVSLAYDYRLVGDNTRYSNPDLELGMIPNNGFAFFLANMIGRKKAFDILSSGKDITADDALKLGIVDKVVPIAELTQAALAMGRWYADKPISYLSGIKSVLHYEMKHLQKVLDHENEVVRLNLGDTYSQ